MALLLFPLGREDALGAPHVSLRHQPDPVERVWFNTNYGQHLALKRYAGYPLDEPIWAIVVHGVFYEHDYVFPGEIAAKVPCVLNYPEHRDEVWSEHKFVVPSSAPFLYAYALYPKQKERRGTLVMPQHTTTLYDVEFDWWAFSDSLRDLPKPVTVLLYYNDIQRGVAKYFPYKTITCGHVNDPEFLTKLVWHMSGAEYVVSNEVGSYTYYATAAGAKFRLIGEPPRMVLNQMGIDNGFTGIFHNSEDRHPEEQRRVGEVDALFRAASFDDPILPEHVECADYYLRRSAFKSPEGLYQDLEYCKSLRGTRP